jgi:recombination protein RecA
MSQALRKLTSSVSKSNTMVIFINQIRMKIGIAYGNPETTTGGNALKFYASIRLDIKRSTPIKDGDVVLGNATVVKVVKNKLAPPFRIAEFDIMYGQGISRASEVVDLGVKAGIIEKAGSWFSYGDEKIGQGKEKVKDFLLSNPKLMVDIENKILKNLGVLEEAMLNTSLHDVVKSNVVDSIEDIEEEAEKVEDVVEVATKPKKTKK